MKHFFWKIILLAGFLPTTLLAAAENILPGENRFLLVVETSPATKNSAKAMEKTVGDLIESGMNGQMKTGDTFGFWTFNDTLNTDFSMQQWDPANHKKLAKITVEFLQKSSFKKPGRLDVALPPVYSVIQASKAITVIFVSSAAGIFSGTTFDHDLNEIRSFYSKDSNPDAPLVTLLVGRKGRPVTYSINSLAGPFYFPNAPAPAAQLVARPRTNSPAATNLLASNNIVVAPTPKVVRPNIILGKSKPAVETPAKISEAELVNPVPKTNQVEIPVNSVEQTNAQNIVTLSQTLPEPKPAINPAPIIETKTNEIQLPVATVPKAIVTTAPPQSQPAITTEGKESSGVESNEKKSVVTNKPAILADSLIPPKRGHSLRGYFWSGAGFVFVFFAVIVWFNFVRRKSQSSLISRSMRSGPK